MTFIDCHAESVSIILVFSNSGFFAETNYTTRTNLIIDKCDGDQLILKQTRMRNITITNCKVNNIYVDNAEQNQQVADTRTNTNNVKDSTFTYDTITIENTCKPFTGEKIYVIFRDTITNFGRKVLKELYMPAGEKYELTLEEIPYELTVYRERKGSGNNNSNSSQKYEIETKFESYKKSDRISKRKRNNRP